MEVRDIIKEMVDNNSSTLDLGNLGFQTIPEKVFELGEALEVLYLTKSYPESESKNGKWLSSKQPHDKEKINLITSIPPSIKKLKNLKKLTIQVVLERNILNFLEMLPSLEELVIIPDKDYLDAQEISKKKVDFSYLGKPKNLKKLWINAIGLQDLDSLRPLEKLEYLNFRNNPIMNIDGLASLKNLQEIHSSGQLKDLKSLSGLEKLERFITSFGNIQDVTPLKKLTSLRFLHLQDQAIEKIEALSNLVNLEYLCLCHNQVADISPLKKLKKLKTFCCMRNKIEDIEIMSNFSLLKKTELGCNKITSIDSLKNLSKLTWLDLRLNQISSLPSWFKNMALKQLKELYLQSNPLKDIPEKIYNTPYSCLAKLKKYLQ